MKKAIILILIATVFLSCGMNVNIQGVDLDLIKERQWGKVAVGALSSIAIHELAHYAAAKNKELDPEYNGPFQVSYSGDRNKQVDRAGFLFQCGIGVILNILPATKESDFTLGWNAVSAIQLTTYHLRDGSDFEIIGNDEWLVFAGASLINTVWTYENIKRKGVEKNARHRRSDN